MNYISKGLQNIYAHHMNPLEKSWETNEITELIQENSDIFALNTDELGEDLKFLSIQERLQINPDILEFAMKVSFDSSTTATTTFEKTTPVLKVEPTFEIKEMEKPKVIKKDFTTKNELDELDSLLGLDSKQQETKIETKQEEEEKKETVPVVSSVKTESKEENLEEWLDGLL
jgi:hypothetical protein